MKKNNNKRDMFTLKDLELKLRNLPDIEPSSNLRNRLLSLIPPAASTFDQQFRIKWYFKILDLGATAATVILILSLTLILNHSLSLPSQPLFSEFQDTSLCYTRWDQNNILYDQNTTYAGVSNFTLPVLKQNEPK